MIKKRNENSQDSPFTPKNDKPKLSIVPRVENNGLCLSFCLKTLLSIFNPWPFCHIKTFLHQLPHHTPLFPSCCWALCHLSSAVPGPGQKNLDTWPRSRAFAERKFPVTFERCGSQLGCQRQLQALATEEVAAATEEGMFIDKHKSISNTGYILRGGDSKQNT